MARIIFCKWDIMKTNAELLLHEVFSSHITDKQASFSHITEKQASFSHITDKQTSFSHITDKQTFILSFSHITDKQARLTVWPDDHMKWQHSSFCFWNYFWTILWTNVFRHGKKTWNTADIHKTSYSMRAVPKLLRHCL